LIERQPDTDYSGPDDVSRNELKVGLIVTQLAIGAGTIYIMLLVGRRLEKSMASPSR
jgi:hypothetical protein